MFPIEVSLNESTFAVARNIEELEAILTMIQTDVNDGQPLRFDRSGLAQGQLGVYTGGW
jgi:hypothetical protein